MTVAVPGTLNGTFSGVSGFSSPTYTCAASSTTSPNGKTYTVTAKGGTQPGAVDVHSASRPFSFLVTKPASIAALPPLNSAGVLPNVPVNTYTFGTRKGVTVLAGQPSYPTQLKTSWSVPAGADLADPSNLAAALIAHAFLLSQVAQGIIDTAVTGEI